MSIEMLDQLPLLPQFLVTQVVFTDTIFRNQIFLLHKIIDTVPPKQQSNKATKQQSSKQN